MTPINSVSRFEDRMKDCVAKGTLEEAKIIERDSAGAAHRIIAMGEGPAFLANGKNRHLLRESDWDRPEFIKEVRRKIEGLMNADLENHVLLSHLEKGQSTPMAEEALFWDIQIPKGGKPLPDMAVKKNLSGIQYSPQPSRRGASALPPSPGWLFPRPCHSRGRLLGPSGPKTGGPRTIPGRSGAGWVFP